MNIRFPDISVPIVDIEGILKDASIPGRERLVLLFSSWSELELQKKSCTYDQVLKGLKVIIENRYHGPLDAMDYVIDDCAEHFSSIKKGINGRLYERANITDFCVELAKFGIVNPVLDSYK